MKLSLQVKGLDAAIKKVKGLDAEMKADLQLELNAFGLDVQAVAKGLAPADEGNLRNAINVAYGDLFVSVIAGVDYAAYLEFGTRKFAAIYVSSLPPDWKTYAASFKGGGGGSGDFFETIRKWVKRKGISDAAAYPIALSILRNGIKAHPFMYPAFQSNVPKLENNLKALFK